MGCPCRSAGEYFLRSSEEMTARSMKGRLFMMRQLRTWPCTETMHFTIIVPSTSFSRACGVYSGFGPESTLGGVMVSLNSTGPVPWPCSTPPIWPPTTPPTTPPPPPPPSPPSPSALHAQILLGLGFRVGWLLLDLGDLLRLDDRLGGEFLLGLDFARCRLVARC